MKGVLQYDDDFQVPTMYYNSKSFNFDLINYI